MIGKGSVLRNAGALVSGSVIAQAITAATMPLITRLFSPEEYGQFSIAMSVLAMLAPTSTLTFFVAVMLPQRASTARRLVILSVATALVSSLIVLMALLVLADPLGAQVGLGGASWLLYFVPPLLLLNGVCDPLAQWLYRIERFGAIARNGVYTVIVQRGLQVALGLAAPTAVALLASQIVTLIWRASLLFMLCRPTLRAARAEGGPRSFRSLVRIYSDFPLYHMPQSLLAALAMNFPVVALGYLFGAAEAAFFAMARALLLLPAVVVSQAMGAALLPRFLRGIRAGEDVHRVLIRVLVLLAGVGVLPFLAVGLFAEDVFALVLGARWSEAGFYAQLLAAMMFMQFLQIPLARTVPALKLQRFQLVAEGVAAVFRMAAIVIGGVGFGSIAGAIGGYAIVSAIASAVVIRTIIARSGSIGPADIDRLRL